MPLQVVFCCSTIDVEDFLHLSFELLKKHLNSEEIRKICQAFSNMEEFRYVSHDVNTLEATISHLLKFLRWKHFSCETFNGRCDNS